MEERRQRVPLLRRPQKPHRRRLRHGPNHRRHAVSVGHAQLADVSGVTGFAACRLDGCSTRRGLWARARASLLVERRDHLQRRATAHVTLIALGGRDVQSPHGLVCVDVLPVAGVQESTAVANLREMLFNNPVFRHPWCGRFTDRSHTTPMGGRRTTAHDDQRRLTAVAAARPSIGCFTSRHTDRKLSCGWAASAYGCRGSVPALLRLTCGAPAAARWWAWDITSAASELSALRVPPACCRLRECSRSAAATGPRGVLLLSREVPRPLERCSAPMPTRVGATRGGFGLMRARARSTTRRVRLARSLSSVAPALSRWRGVRGPAVWPSAPLLSPADAKPGPGPGAPAGAIAAAIAGCSSTLQSNTVPRVARCIAAEAHPGMRRRGFQSVWGAPPWTTRSRTAYTQSRLFRSRLVVPN